VQFYENEHFLARTVAEFVSGGLLAKQPVVMIATALHRQAVTSRLAALGIDVDHVVRSGQFSVLDARETLGAFMVAGHPDAARFRAAVGQVIESGLANHSVSQPTLRAYGEMVDLLWKDGNIEGAIELEELWNELAESYPFSLLCAYAMGNFYKESHASDFERICATHSHVVPTERYQDTDEEARLIEVSRLQQRAQALENEIEH
jgi:hypothetical protein